MIFFLRSVLIGVAGKSMLFALIERIAGGLYP